jgi:transcription antitermination factor NusG
MTPSSAFPIGYLAPPQEQESPFRVIRCLTGKELVVSGQLFHFGIPFEVLMHPVKKHRHGVARPDIVQRPLFPGYVLLKYDDERRGALLQNLAYVIDFLRFGSKLAAVYQEEVDLAKTMLASGLPMFPRIELIRGQKVRVKYGPLTGVVGEFSRWRGEDQLVANFEMFGRSVGTRMACDQVEAVA